jgi:hypothetical protein
MKEVDIIHKHKSMGKKETSSVMSTLGKKSVAERRKRMGEKDYRSYMTKLAKRGAKKRWQNK